MLSKIQKAIRDRLAEDVSSYIKEVTVIRRELVLNGDDMPYKVSFIAAAGQGIFYVSVSDYITADKDGDRVAIIGTTSSHMQAPS